MGRICCFAGHGKWVYGEDVKKKLLETCEDLIVRFGVREFWVGNYGDFDKLAAFSVRLLKEKYSHICLNLVVPYLTKEINEYSEQYYARYDQIVMAEVPERTPKRVQILKCNQYMVNQSEFLVAYVQGSFGGAAKTLEYAKQKKHIEIFNLGV